MHVRRAPIAATHGGPLGPQQTMAPCRRRRELERELLEGSSSSSEQGTQTLSADWLLFRLGTSPTGEGDGTRAVNLVSRRLRLAPVEPRMACPSCESLNWRKSQRARLNRSFGNPIRLLNFVKLRRKLRANP